MGTNTNLTREVAIKLLRSEEVVCPACNGAVLKPRHNHKNQNTRYVCPECKEVFRPYKLI